MKLKHMWIFAAVIVLLGINLYFDLRRTALVRVEEPLKVSTFMYYKRHITLEVLNADGLIPEEIVVDFIDADNHRFATETIQVRYAPNGNKLFRFDIPSPSLLSYTPTQVKIRLP